MSRLTEIMKQIPLDELTGDVEMKERNERNIKVTSGGGGGMVGRRIGLIGTAAACAVLAAGGVFAYSKLSKSPEDKRATNITSTVEGHSEAYSRNLAIYKTYYEKSISADFSLVERNTAPLEEDSPVTEFEGLKLRVIGTRSLGSFIRVDVGVENPDGKIFHVRPSDDVKLILPDGSSISGCGCNSAEPSWTPETTVFSFEFPTYQRDSEGKTVSVKNGDKLKLSVDSIPILMGEYDEIKHLKDYTAEFTYTAGPGYDHVIKTDTDVTWPGLLLNESTDRKVCIKEIRYSAAGAELVFSIEDADDAYRQQVLDYLYNDGFINGYDRNKYSSYDEYLATRGYDTWTSEFDNMAYAASDAGSLRYLTKFDANTLRLIDKREGTWDFVLSRDYFEDPLPTEQITKFVLGKEQTEVPVPRTEQGAHSEAYRRNLEAYKAYFADMNIDFDRAMTAVHPLENDAPAVTKHTDKGDLNVKMIGYRASGPFIRVDLGITTDAKEYDFEYDSSEKPKLYLPDGRYIEGSFIRGINPKAVGFEFPAFTKDADGGEIRIEDGALLNFSLEGFYTAQFEYQSPADYSFSIGTEIVTETYPFVEYLSHTEKVKIRHIAYSNTGAAVTFSVMDMSDDYLRQVEEQLCKADSDPAFTGSEKFVTAVENSGYERYLFSVKANNPRSVMFERLKSGDFVAYREFFDDPIKADEIGSFKFGMDQTPVSAADLNKSEPVSSVSEQPVVPINMENLDVYSFIEMHYDEMPQEGRNAKYIAKLSGRINDYAVDLDFGRTLTVKLPDGRKVSLENITTAKLGTLPENNINTQTTFAGTLPVSELGLENGSYITLMIDDLYDVNGVKWAEGHYEQGFFISYPEEEDTPSAESNRSVYLLKSAKFCDWSDENGEYKLDKIAAVYSEPTARTVKGFEGMDMQAAGLVTDESGRFIAPVVGITCDDRDGVFLDKDPVRALSVTNDIILKTSDGKEIRPIGEGWAAEGSSGIICAPTFDLKDLGEGSRGKATLVIRKLLKDDGTVIAEGEFTTEIVLS